MYTTFKDRVGRTVMQQTHVYCTWFVGQRVDSVTFEGWHEMKELFTDRGREWASKCLLPAMRIKDTNETPHTP